MEKDKTIELLEESRSRMHRLIDERYDELLGSLADGRRISEKPRTMALTSSPFLFKGEKPVSLTMRDGRTIPTPTWKSVALAVLKDCNNEPEMHQRLMNLRGSVAGRTRFILSANHDDMNVPLKIDDDLYFEGKFDSEYLMKMMTERVLNPVGYDCSGISVTLRPHELTETIVEDTADISDEEETEGFGIQMM